ncbi:amidohydrolase family protein, partial [Actinomadura coerulea]|uniref:amidohydrolase family protein n=1 Tax=Actinomadura coerulea TaxID=46159 RepID=UPI003437CE40
DHKVGSLTPGKEADIVLIDAEAAGSMPLNNAVGTVVMGANPGNVAAVFVAGEARKWDGKLVGVDIDAVRREAVASRDRLVAESGVPLEVVG